jgi:hypothetical protein
MVSYSLQKQDCYRFLSNTVGWIEQGHALRYLYYTVTKHILIRKVNVS